MSGTVYDSDLVHADESINQDLFEVPADAVDRARGCSWWQAVDVLEVDGVTVVITRCMDWGRAVWRWLPQERMSFKIQVTSKV